MRVDGELRAVPLKVFDFIVYLLVHRHRTVAGDELIQQVWSDRKISRTAVHRTLMLARRALGDRARAPRFIRTVNKVGFRFIGEIENTATELANASASLNQRPARIGTMRPEPTLALLEFDNQTLEPTLARIHEGIYWIIFGIMQIEQGAVVVTSPHVLMMLRSYRNGNAGLRLVELVRDLLEPDWIVDGQVFWNQYGYRLAFMLTNRAGVRLRGKVEGADLIVAAMAAGEEIKRLIHSEPEPDRRDD